MQFDIFITFFYELNALYIDTLGWFGMIIADIGVFSEAVKMDKIPFFWSPKPHMLFYGL